VIKSLDVIQGTLDLIILKALALESGHGWGISDRIRTMSNDVFKVGQGSLYPALQRILVKGWAKAEWGISETGRRVRFYRLTAAGKKQLTRETEQWNTIAVAIAAALASA